MEPRGKEGRGAAGEGCKRDERDRTRRQPSRHAPEGATRAQVETLFLAEAAALATLGGMLGLGAGLLIALGIRTILPSLPLQTPQAFVLAGLGVSFVTGLTAGIVPARRAAGLDPVEALRAE